MVSGENRPAGGRRARPWTLGWGYNVLLVVPGLFLAVFFAWPLLRVVVRGFTEPGIGLQNYERLVSTSLYVKVLYNTVETATMVTVLCLLIGYPLAYVVSRARGARLRLYMALVLIPLWTSVVIRSYAWMIVFQRKGLINDLFLAANVIDTPVHFLPGSLAVHLGMVHIMLPFMLLPMIAAMRGIDETLLCAADVLGAHPFRRFLHVFLPLSMPGVTAGVALVFMLSLGFFVTPALLGGPKHMMAAVLIEQQANVYLNWGLASSLSTALLILTTGIYLVYLRATRGSSTAVMGA